MAGIYIHIPFCKQKCSYCDFHFSTVYEKYRSRMIKAMKTEIKSRKNYLKNAPINTIYFGGGTPSLLTPTEIQELVVTIQENYPLQKEMEFTLEANPDDISEEQLEAWKKIGVNRLSIGVQSFFQEDLDWMNRAHSVEEAIRALQLARKHNFLLTADLIYGLPKRNLVEWKSNIHQLVALQPEHISAYCLTVEKQTALYKMLESGELPRVSEDEQANQFEVLVEELETAGYQQYEISNFAKENMYAAHNSNYWRGVPYLGIGPSAHSFDGKSRRWNVANNHQYMKKIEKNDIYFETETLSPKDQFNELILTGLRTKWGVSLSDLQEKHPFTTEFSSSLKEFIDLKLVVEKEQTIILTSKGKLQADHIASMLFLD